MTERFDLDPTGNWTDYVQKTSGTTVLDEDRDHNMVNELDVDEDHSNSPGASITASAGTNWYDPSYDAAGNMTGVPKPADPAIGLTCTFDAWNRLVEVPVYYVVTFRYGYDGLNRRSVTARYITGNPSNYNHRYYNASWQVLETRVYDSSGQPETAPPKYQYVWSARYIDSPVLRDWNSDSDNYCDDHRLYYLGDANFNVTCLVGTGGDPLEQALGHLFDRFAVEHPPHGHGEPPSLADHVGRGVVWRHPHSFPKNRLRKGRVLPKRALPIPGRRVLIAEPRSFAGGQ